MDEVCTSPVSPNLQVGSVWTFPGDLEEADRRPSRVAYIAHAQTDFWVVLMAKQSELVLAGERAAVPRQKSMVDQDTYAKAHATYSKMDAATLKAHDTAMSHVRRGLAAATKAQLAEGSGY